MAKNPQNYPHSAQEKLLDNLDFSATQKQVDALMKTVLHDNTLNENKICFIQEQLNDQRYQVHPKIIAKKMFEHLDNSDLPRIEETVEV